MKAEATRELKFIEKHENRPSISCTGLKSELNRVNDVPVPLSNWKGDPCQGLGAPEMVRNKGRIKRNAKSGCQQVQIG